MVKKIDIQEKVEMEIEERDGFEYVKFTMPEKLKEEMAKLVEFTAGTLTI